MNDFDEMFDFVIAGSGGGSMCAGLVMRAAERSVVILEKSSVVGGTTARSGGVMWIPNNRFMKRDGVDDSYESAETYLNSVIKDDGNTPGTSPTRRRTYLTQAPRMIDFLVRQGIKLTRVKCYPDYYNDLPGGSEKGRTVIAELFDVNELGSWKARLQPGFLALPATLPEAQMLPHIRRSWRSKRTAARVVIRGVIAKLTGKHWVSAGAALQGRMLQAALKTRIDIRTESKVSELIVADGAVVGVKTVKDGRSWRIGARLGVLVNAGGFARNQRMRDTYQNGISSQWTSVVQGDTGEMIEEMMRHGAAIGQMDERVGHQITLPPGSEGADINPSAQNLTAAPHAILVDGSGLRYLNEGGSYMTYCKAMLERHKSVPAVPSWAIFDRRCMRDYMVAGTMPGSRKPQRWYDEGYLRKAESIEALALMLAMDPVVLRGTIDRFNSFVAQNRDDDFHRGANAYDCWLGDPYHQPSATLGSIDEGPFYALPVLPGDVGTYGGVVTDEQARVLREDGTAIPGLYATGVSTASVMGRVYPGAGSSVGPSFVWGYIAARHAASLSGDDL